MSYAYMKALESAPERYDKGINWLGWGHIEQIRTYIADIAASEGERILEIGAGTGGQALMMAERGLEVVAIDQSTKMLAIAESKLDVIRKENEASGKDAPNIKFLQMSAAEIDGFPDGSFDTVTSTLVFSELFQYEQRYVLAHAFRVLKPGGVLILADETIPRKRLKGIAHKVISLPLKLITYLMTQTSTKPLHDMTEKVKGAGFTIEQDEEYQLGAFRIVVARKPDESIASDVFTSIAEPESLSPPKLSFFSTLWQTVLRIVPHPTEIGLIPVGQPTEASPVLCTCNFKLTVQRLCDLLAKKHMSAWVLVAPTGGENVWCASVGGRFNAESVITAIKVSHLERYVSHRKIILPQLAAPGVDRRRISKTTGWHCTWGPVRMDDLPDYLADFPKLAQKKTERQRTVLFDVHNRIEMALVMLFPILLILGTPLFLLLILFDRWGWILPLFLECVTYYFGVFLLWPKIPARLGQKKVAIYSAVFMSVLFIGSWTLTQYSGFAFPSILSFSGPLAVLNWWPLELFMIVLAVLLWYDADGSTPTQRSSLLANAWNKGKTRVLERWGSHVSPTEYGVISVRLESCTGCGDCVEVCPVLIPEIEPVDRKVHLTNLENCINCHACITQCPTEALFLAPETEAARAALESLQGD
jgi:ubiquinone/menaquinone biosynthesis C-methylase UbiE/ferredoxin